MSTELPPAECRRMMLVMRLQPLALNATYLGTRLQQLTSFGAYCVRTRGNLSNGLPC